jgi:hypothetical protein
MFEVAAGQRDRGNMETKLMQKRERCRTCGENIEVSGFRCQLDLVLRI